MTTAYDNLPSDEDSFLGAGSEDDDDGDASEAKLEKLLLANMSSSDEEEERGVSDSVQKPLKKKRKMCVTIRDTYQDAYNNLIKFKGRKIQRWIKDLIPM